VKTLLLNTENNPNHDILDTIILILILIIIIILIIPIIIEIPANTTNTGIPPLPTIHPLYLLRKIKYIPNIVILLDSLFQILGTISKMRIMDISLIPTLTHTTQT
jgi:hypothetical protein